MWQYTDQQELAEGDAVPQPGARLGRYEIAERIGAGGMGEVFRAIDTALGRQVAIKVLPVDFAADPQRLWRFEQEARAASALNHPNVLVVHDAGTHEGSPYLVMELLEGKPLRSILQEARLSPRRAIEYAVQIARGLAAAHGRGIVHRDLKPENLFVTRDGVVKILDFGIAKLVEGQRTPEELARAATRMQATEPGAVLGTFAYMSPEQALGQAVDQRSDIFSFGVVLYEMLAGVRPFVGETAAETVKAILSKDPLPLGGARVEVPVAVEGIVGRCLEKRPDDRFSSAHDLALALELISDAGKPPVSAPRPPLSKVGAGWSSKTRLAIGAGAVALVLLAAAGASWLWHHQPGASAGLNPKRILVVPFENVTGDRSLDSLGRLASDWIIQGLLQTEQVEVASNVVAIGQGEAAGAPGEAVMARALASGAGTIIAGAYYATGEDLEMQGRLMDTRSSKVLYAAEPVRCRRTGPTECVDRVRQRLMGAVATQFGLPAFTRIIQRPPVYEAYNEYLAALEAHGIDLPKAIAHFERAVQLDPDFMIAQIRLASAYWNSREWSQAEALFAKLHARTERMTPVERLFLDFIEADTHGRLTEAREAAKKIHALVPGDIVITLQVAQTALWIGRPKECLATVGDITPILKQFAGLRQSSWWVTMVARAHHALGEHEAELEIARKGVEAFPDMLSMHSLVARALAALGRLEELDRALDATLTLPSGSRTPADAMLDAADELRVHGHREDGLRLAKRAVAWFRGQATGQTRQEIVTVGMVRALRTAEMWDEARAAANRLVAAEPESVDGKGYAGAIAAHLGDRSQAMAISSSLADSVDWEDPGAPTLWRARIAAQLGEREQAVSLLREAFRQGQVLIVVTHADPDLEPLANEPTFQSLVRPQG